MLAPAVLLTGMPLRAQSGGFASPISIYTAPSEIRSAAAISHATVPVEADVDWVDTGIAVHPDDTVHFTASGALQSPSGRAVSPAGVPRGWRDMLRGFPVDGADAGALVSRIGAGDAAVPFVIGAGATIVAHSAGHVFVRCNTNRQTAAPAAGQTAPGAPPAAVWTGRFQLSVQVVPAALDAHLSEKSAHAAALLRGLPPARLEALPRRVADASGHPGDVVNFALLGTEEQVRAALESAGWVSVDADVQSAMLHGLLNTLQHKPYLEVPMSPLYLFGRVQDLSYARASALTVARERHHLRCWNTGTVQNGLPLWVGSATHDVGFARDERNGRITHSIVPEIDAERDFLRDTVLAAGAADAVGYFRPAAAVREGTTATGGAFTTDGRVLVALLR